MDIETINMKIFSLVKDVFSKFSNSKRLVSAWETNHRNSVNRLFFKWYMSEEATYLSQTNKTFQNCSHSKQWNDEVFKQKSSN